MYESINWRVCESCMFVCVRSCAFVYDVQLG